MKKSALWLSITTLFLCAPARAEVRQERYPFAKALAPADAAASAARFGAFVLDEEIFGALNSRRSNLRIIDGTGAEVPFLIRTQTGERTVEELNRVPFKKLSFAELPDNRIEIELERDPSDLYRTSQISSAEIASSLRNFEKFVSLWHSRDRTSWELLAEERPIFDYSRYIDIRNSLVAFPQSDARYIRLRIANITEQRQSPFTHYKRTLKAGEAVATTESFSLTHAEFKIDAVTFFERVTRSVPGRSVVTTYNAADFSLREEEKKSIVSFTTARVPLSEIRPDIGSAFFHRRYSLDTSADGKRWTTLQSGTISCAGPQSAGSGARVIRLARPHRAAHWRIVIHNEDSPALEIRGVETAGDVHEAVFYCNPAMQYRVLYGAGDATTPVYDIGRVLAQAQIREILPFTAGAQTDNPRFTEGPRRAFALSSRTVMVGAVILMVAVLAWLIAQTVRKIE
jgi:hypothetical protein